MYTLDIVVSIHVSGADPKFFHVGWLSGWLPIHYYTESWGKGGGGGWQARIDLFP